MPCEHYKNALVEAIASGAEPQGELRAHLAACASCRAAYAEEQSLFAAIDSGLRSAANTDVPPSLLPRVRAGLDEAVAPQRRWMQPLIFASASMAMVVLIFLMVRPHHATPENMAEKAPVSAPTAVEPATHANPVGPSKDIQTVFVTKRHSSAGRNSTNVRSVLSGTPEVLVPPNEREAFARFVATLNERSGVAASLLARASEKEGSLVNGDPLQIPDLEIKPLEGPGAETPDGAGEKR